ncbi:MAG: hypothetical protein H6718_07285 [Polyangiaceae bacterium]|nr:hypothetical protein [Polyangiaceae bacterium]
MGGKWPQNPGSTSGVPELDLFARTPASGPRQSRPNPQGNPSGDPQDLFGAGTFDADFFGGESGGKLDLNDAPGGMIGGMGYGNELTLEPGAASNLELGGQGPSNPAADPSPTTAAIWTSVTSMRRFRQSPGCPAARFAQPGSGTGSGSLRRVSLTA